MTAFTTHFAYDFRTGIRNKNLLMLNYLFPLGFYFMMGAIMPAINPAFRDVLLPAMVTFAILASTLLGLPDPLVSARESGIFRSYKINGIPARSILTIPAVTTALHLSIVTLIIAVTAPLLFDATLPQNWVLFGLVIVATLIACTGIGVLIGVIAPSTRMTVLYSQIIFLPSMLLGGMMMPFNMLPEGAQMIAKLLPSTHAMNAFNGLAMGVSAEIPPNHPLVALTSGGMDPLIASITQSAWISTAALITSGLIAFAMALLLFRWDNNTRPRIHPLAALLVLLPFAITLFL